MQADQNDVHGQFRSHFRSDSSTFMVDQNERTAARLQGKARRLTTWRDIKFDPVRLEVRCNITR